MSLVYLYPCLYIQGKHYSQLLENERRMVVSLRSSLTAKERELTETVDKFLQEKVTLAKAQGELTALRARCETDRQHISSLQSKVTSLIEAFYKLYIVSAATNILVHTTCIDQALCLKSHPYVIFCFHIAHHCYDTCHTFYKAMS